jgi:hypothetical protein
VRPCFVFVQSVLLFVVSTLTTAAVELEGSMLRKCGTDATVPVFTGGAQQPDDKAGLYALRSVDE